MPCTVYTPWGADLHVIDKTTAQVIALAEAGRPFVVKTDSLPGANADVWIRSATVQMVVPDDAERV